MSINRNLLPLGMGRIKVWKTLMSDPDFRKEPLGWKIFGWCAIRWHLWRDPGLKAYFVEIHRKKAAGELPQRPPYKMPEWGKDWPGKEKQFDFKQ
jgi:hypothetical protein